MSQFRFVNYENIDKKKWENTLYFAYNRNVFGQYWYLKSVLPDWGAIVSDDYSIIMPVFTTTLQHFQYELLHELGPYSIKSISEEECASIFELFEKHNVTSNYPINSRLDISKFKKGVGFTKNFKAVLTAEKTYIEASKNFSDSFTSFLSESPFDRLDVISSMKPESFVGHLSASKKKKDALVKIMYNATYKGLSFVSGLKSKNNDDLLALSYFIKYQSDMIELVSYTKDNKAYRQLIFDMIMRNNYGGPMKISSYTRVNDLHEMGFDSEPIQILQLDDSLGVSLRKMMGFSY